MFVRILIGLALVAIGAFFVIRTRTFLEFFGTIDWAEIHMGSGGSNLLYKVLGLIVCLVGFLVATNLWNAFLDATIGSIFGGLGRQPS